MTASDINQEISFWIHLGGVSLITIFGVGTSTLNMNRIFQWQQRKKNKVSGETFALASLPSHLTLLVSLSVLSLLLLCFPWWHQNSVPSSSQHEVKPVVLWESSSSGWEWILRQPTSWTEQMSCSQLLHCEQSRCWITELYQVSHTNESLFSVYLFYQLCSCMEPS